MPFIRLTFLGVLLPAIALIGTAGSSQPTLDSFPRGPIGNEDVWEETLWAARDTGFDYLGSANSARNGDVAALDRLLQFSRETDAASALGHGVVLIRLLRELDDPSFAAALEKRPHGEKPLLRGLLRAGLAYGFPETNPDCLSSLFPISYRATER
ncbi:MAG TPA: hypothetical protein VNM14_00115 [Planctomycetota bacterium]|jgi:hypothetical protein|nr:hypothetical protein [Planctomycetota bacterium]